MTQVPNHPSNRGERENDNLRPDGDGKPPRPATEPPGAESSTQNSKTATDPGSGEPQNNS